VHRLTLKSWVENEDLTFRSTRQVIEDHIRLQIAGQFDEDLRRNYAQDIVLLTESGREVRGYEAVRNAASRLYQHGPGSCYEMVALTVIGEYGLLIWKISAPDYVIDGAADSFVVVNGKIRMQSSHYKLLESVARAARIG
jgi:hypothetical protein